MNNKVLANGSSIKICVLILVFCVSLLILIEDIQHVGDKNPVQSWHHRTCLSQDNNFEYTDQNFLLTIDFHQQTTASFKSYTRLAKIAGLLNLSSVEPYVYYDGLKGGANCNDRNALKLSKLYNLTHVEEFMKPCCPNTELKSFEEFLHHASRNVVFVSFVTGIRQHHFSFLKGRNIVELDCHIKSSNIHSSIQTLNNWAVSYYTNQFFSCSRVVLLDARPKHELPLIDIIDVLGSIVNEQVAKFGSATVVLDTWRGVTGVADSSSFYSYVPGFTIEKGCYVVTIEHSKLVISAAPRFVKHFNLTQPAVGVHIRGERLLRDAHNIEYSIDCLQQLYNLLHNHSVDNYFPENVYVFHDLGEYGSASCEVNIHCKNGRSKFLSKLEQLRFRVVYFDPSNFKSFPNSRVFASFVEREYLSHVQVLVTVGRGGFQQSIVDRFLKFSKENNNHLHRICNSESP